MLFWQFCVTLSYVYRTEDQGIIIKDSISCIPYPTVAPWVRPRWIRQRRYEAVPDLDY
jgi:hypothetical protein